VKNLIYALIGALVALVLAPFILAVLVFTFIYDAVMIALTPASEEESS